VDRICDLYDEVFSQPPFFWRADESQLHRGRLLRLLDDPSFGVTLAWDGQRVHRAGRGPLVPAGGAAI
jgi:hypothetical protein